MSQPLFRLSDHDLRGLAAAIRSHRIAPPWTALALQRLLPSSVCEAAAAELRLLADQGLSGDQLAAMLEFVVGDREHPRAEAETIELVTSGPEGPGITNRDTSVVLRELFSHADSSVLVAGYAVYQGQRVFQALASTMGCTTVASRSRGHRKSSRTHTGRRGPHVTYPFGITEPAAWQSGQLGLRADGWSGREADSGVDAALRGKGDP